MDFDPDDVVTVEKAAEIMGCTTSNVNQMLNKELMPFEKIGRKRFIERAIVETTIELKSKYGRRWASKAPWNGGEGQEEIKDVPPGLNAELLKLSRKYRAAGQAEIALKLNDILLDQYEF